MFCPADGTLMHTVSITSHYGQPIILDQCDACGGIWFDESELYRAKQGEAEKIDPVNADKLQIPAVIEKTNLRCPKDKTLLSRFTDKYFPADLVLERCSACKGIWLNRGVFSKYQEFRDSLLSHNEKSPEDTALQESIRELLTSYQSGQNTQVLEKLGKFLSTPLGKDTSPPQNAIQETQNTVGIALNILVTLFRLFILRF